MKRSLICTGSCEWCRPPACRRCVRRSAARTPKRIVDKPLALHQPPMRCWRTAAGRDGDDIGLAGVGYAPVMVDAVIHHDHGEIFRRVPRWSTGSPSASAASHLLQRKTRRVWAATPSAIGKAGHAAQHVEILAGGRPPQAEIGGRCRRPRLPRSSVLPEPRGEIETVHHLGVAGRVVAVVHALAHLSNTLPPVNSGARISATGACVVQPA